MSRDWRDDEWVHERDYGSFAIGGIILGLIEIIVGIVQLILYPFRKK